MDDDFQPSRTAAEERRRADIRVMNRTGSKRSNASRGNRIKQSDAMRGGYRRGGTQHPGSGHESTYQNRSNDGGRSLRATSGFAAHNKHKRRGKRENKSKQLKGDSTSFCWDWTRKGVCTKGSNCRYSHMVRLVCSLPQAHQRGVYAMASASREPTAAMKQAHNLADGVQVVDLYTGSQDKTLRAWVLIPSVTADGCPSLKSELVEEYKFETAVLSLHVALGCVFCGLANGDVVALDRATGRRITLKGHSAEVHCVEMIDTVLVTADWNGKVNLWKAGADNSGTMTVQATLELSEPSSCFTEVTILAPDGITTVKRELWVGCTGALKIIDLLTLTVKRTINFTTPDSKTTPVVISLICLEGHVISCLLGMGVKVFRALDYEEVALAPEQRVRRTFCSMEGSCSEDGPVLLCGSPDGRFAVLSLPALKELALCKIHDRDIRAIHNIGGQPSFFATASMSGDIDVWYWRRPPAEQAPAVPLDNAIGSVI